VLSPSTEAYDRGVKFEFYRTLASLSDYILVAQNRLIVERFTRQADGRWLLATYTGLTAIAPISSIGCELRLADVYDKVEWPAAEARLPSLSRGKESGAGYAAP
jgi:Uma2 family endonuclease